MKKLVVISVCLLVASLSVNASAAPGEVKIGHFEAVLDGTGLLASGGGDGYIWPGGAVWQYYDQVPGEDPWWNQWWYNDPYQPGGKDIRLQFEFDAAGSLEVTINWSNQYWVGMDRPPGSDEEQYIERLEISGWPMTWHAIFWASVDTGWFTLPIEYNPEWVSVDIRATNTQVYNGIIEHVCIPEPASFMVLALGGLAALVRRRK